MVNIIKIEAQILKIGSFALFLNVVKCKLNAKQCWSGVSLVSVMRSGGGSAGGRVVLQLGF